MSSIISDVANIVLVIQIVLTALVGMILWSMRASFLTRKDFETFKTKELTPFHDDVGRRLTAQSERLTAGDGRFGQLEARMAALPTARDVADLRVAMEKLSGDVRWVTGKFEGLGALHDTLKTQVQVMDEFLRKMA